MFQAAFVCASFLGMVGNIHGDRSVCPNQIAIDGLSEAFGGCGDTLVLELDLALTALVILGADVAVHDLQRQDHVVQVGNIAELKFFVPNGIQVALLDGGFLVSKVLVAVGSLVVGEKGVEWVDEMRCFFLRGFRKSMGRIRTTGQ